MTSITSNLLLQASQEI